MCRSLSWPFGRAQIWVPQDQRKEQNDEDHREQDSKGRQNGGQSPRVDPMAHEQAEQSEGGAGPQLRDRDHGRAERGLSAVLLQCRAGGGRAIALPPLLAAAARTQPALASLAGIPIQPRMRFAQVVPVISPSRSSRRVMPPAGRPDELATRVEDGTGRGRPRNAMRHVCTYPGEFVSTSISVPLKVLPPVRSLTTASAVRKYDTARLGVQDCAATLPWF
jgi:hypothetical protein